MSCTICAESAKLQQDLQKVEQLESKINQELDSLNAKINKMTEELVIYSDLDKLKADAEKKKRVFIDDVSILVSFNHLLYII